MTETENPGKERRIPELDGLRGLALLSVLSFGYVIGPAVPGGLVSHFQRLVSMAEGAGLDLFYILSGFLIGGILLDAQTRPCYFKTFYARRFFRIIPLYYSWIILFVLMVRFAGPLVEAHTHYGVKLAINSSIYAEFLFLQDAFFLHLPGIAGLTLAWFSTTWPLPVIAQFYALAPLVVRKLSKRRLYQVLIATIILAPVLRFCLLTWAHITSDGIDFFILTKADIFAVGILTAALWREYTFRDWLGSHKGLLYGLFFALLASFVGFWAWLPNYVARPMLLVGYTVVALFYGVLLMLVLQDSAGPIAWLMRMAWLRAIGVVSYCIFMIHMVVNAFCHTVLLHANPQVMTRRGVAVTLFAAVVSFGIAGVSRICFERPLLRLGHKFKYEEVR